MGTIRLYRDGSSWISDVSKATGAAETRRLFDADQIPTTFKASADAETVRQAVSALNPEDQVLVRDSY